MRKRMPKSLNALIAMSFPLVRLLPVKIATELLASVFGRISSVFLKPDTIKSNIQVAFPNLNESAVDALIVRMAANFGRHIAEIVHISTFGSGAQGTSITSEGPIDVPFELQGPAIYIGAHLGSWELIPLVFQRHSRPLTIMYSQIDHPLLDRLFLSQRQKTGGKYVEKNEALKACLKAMQKGESVALLVDQRVDAGVEVDFFGRPSIFTPLPARLARRFNCPIIPCEAVRVAPGHLQVTFHAPIWPSTERGVQTDVELTQEMARAIEDSIRRNVDTWFCNKRRWANQEKAHSSSTQDEMLEASANRP